MAVKIAVPQDSRSAPEVSSSRVACWSHSSSFCFLASRKGFFCSKAVTDARRPVLEFLLCDRLSSRIVNNLGSDSEGESERPGAAAPSSDNKRV